MSLSANINAIYHNKISLRYSSLLFPCSRVVRVRRGFSLIELAMSLAMIALMVAGIMIFFSNASTEEKTEEVASELAAIQQAVHTLYNEKYGSVTSVDIANSGLLPDKWVSGSGTSVQIISPFKGESIYVNQAGNSEFIVEIDQLPQATCVSLAIMDLGQNLADIDILGSSGGGGFYATALTPSQASSACGNVANNTIDWYFH